MSRKFKIRDQEAVHFVTFTIVNWLDVFIRSEYRDIFLDSIRYCQKNKGLQVYAYCVMSSHVHMIIARCGNQNLQDIIRDVKKYTSFNHNCYRAKHAGEQARTFSLVVQRSRLKEFKQHKLSILATEQSSHRNQHE